MTGRMRWRALAGALLLPLVVAGCGSASPGSARYIGPAPACGRTEGGGTTATLSRLGSGFAFAPYDGAMIVEGKVGADGAMSGSLPLRPAKTGPASGAAKPSTGAAQAVTVKGRIAGETATLAYAAPGCAATLTLARVHPPLL